MIRILCTGDSYLGTGSFWNYGGIRASGGCRRSASCEFQK